MIQSLSSTYSMSNTQPCIYYWYIKNIYLLLTLFSGINDRYFTPYGVPTRVQVSQTGYTYVINVPTRLPYDFLSY